MACEKEEKCFHGKFVFVQLFRFDIFSEKQSEKCSTNKKIKFTFVVRSCQSQLGNETCSRADWNHPFRKIVLLFRMI